jgi:hypothetical protein
VRFSSDCEEKNVLFRKKKNITRTLAIWIFYDAIFFYISPSSVSHSLKINVSVYKIINFIIEPLSISIWLERICNQHTFISLKMDDRTNQCYFMPNISAVNLYNLYLKHLYIRLLFKGRAMAQAISRRPSTAEARVRPRVSPCGICGEKVTLGEIFSQVRLFSSVSIIPPVLHYL